MGGSKEPPFPIQRQFETTDEHRWTQMLRTPDPEIHHQGTKKMKRSQKSDDRMQKAEALRSRQSLCLPLVLVLGLGLVWTMSDVG